MEALRRTSADTGERLAQLRPSVRIMRRSSASRRVVANQVAHLHALIEGHMGSNPAQREQQLADAAAAVARRLLETYAHWCLRLHEPPRAASSIHDALLYLLIWGEGANLRHMPELLASSTTRCTPPSSTPNRPTCRRRRRDGEPPPARQSSPCDSFLDDVGRRSTRSSPAVQDRVNYDDINEFFWYRGCLGFQPFEGPNHRDRARRLPQDAHGVELVAPRPPLLHRRRLRRLRPRRLHLRFGAQFVRRGAAASGGARAARGDPAADRALLVELFDLWAESAVA